MAESNTFKWKDGEDRNGYYVAPSAGESASGVVVLQEGWGLNDQINGAANLLADTGYRALVPDLCKGKVALDALEAEHLMSNHGFGNETDENYDPAAKDLAWKRTLEFLVKYI